MLIFFCFFGFSLGLKVKLLAGDLRTARIRQVVWHFQRELVLF